MQAKSMSCTRLIMLSITVLWLGACASTVPRPITSGPSASGAGATGAGAPVPDAFPRRGGYYMDDGPLDQPAPDPSRVADAVPKAEPLIAKANRPYNVFGRAYQPMTALRPFRERGIASWYGRKFHGNRTSSGEVYDMFAMTAAHPTLPLPSYVRVTRVATGQSIVVRVNDRGPFLNNRVIDLSYTAANKLGYVNAGSTEVELELIVEAQQQAGVSTSIPIPIPTSTSTSTFVPARIAESKPSSPNAGAVLVAGVEPAVVSIPIEPKSVVAIGASPSESAAGAVGDRLVIETQIAQDPRPAAMAPPRLADSAKTSDPGKTSGPTNAAPMADAFYLQLAAFGENENAQAARMRLKSQVPWLSAPIDIYPQASWFKLQAGPFGTRDEALAAAQRIRTATGLRPFATVRSGAR